MAAEKRFTLYYSEAEEYECGPLVNTDWTLSPGAATYCGRCGSILPSP